MYSKSIKMSLVFVILACLYGQSMQVDRTAFYPYGPDNGDSTLFINDDGYAGPIPISTAFNFFATPYSSLFVNTNGIISFDSGVSSYTPNPFPVPNIKGVAPFWGDVDTRNGGNIYYREISSNFNQIDSDIRTAFPEFDDIDYQSTWAYVVTWLDVSRFGAFQNENLRNTFQAIITTDGTYSFAIYNYDELVWTFGTASNGTHAQAGFNAGDGVNFHIIQGSFTLDVININQRSNVGVAGKYIFRLDLANIATPEQTITTPEPTTTTPVPTTVRCAKK